MRLIATPVTVEAMRPFGALVEPPANAGDRALYTEWLGTTSAAATPRLHVNYVPETQLPCRITLLEKHPHGAQIFLPLEVSRYFIIVAPSLPSGLPDLAGVRAFIAPGKVGVVYRANTWHAGATALDDKGHFAVNMWRNDMDDDVFFDLEEPLEITI